MQYRMLGRSGLKVSAIAMGTFSFGGVGGFAKVANQGVEEARRLIDSCIDLGVNLFDTANMYSLGRSEEILGEALGAKRNDVLISSKARMRIGDGPNDEGASRYHIIRECERSLKRLKRDHIDIYFMHEWDGLTPLDETLEALHTLREQGKIRYIGCSNLPSWQVADAHWTARTLGLEGFASAQDEYSLLVRGAEKELIPAISHFGMGLLPYFPLANGLLTGKYQRNAPMPEGARMTREAQRAGEVLTEANWQRTEKLAAFCDARGKTLLELAFSWLAAQPVVSSVIAGATKPEQVAANVKAADWALTPEELAEIDAITR